MPRRTCSISTPSRSARLAISFMKEMRTASMQLAAYLVNSAERISITINRSRFRLNGAYNWRSVSADFASSTPMMTAIRFHEVFNRKSFFQKFRIRGGGRGTWLRLPLSSTRRAARTWSLVPTGTVDLTTIRESFWMSLPSSRAHEITCDKSAEPSSSEGVPTAMKISVACDTASLVVG